MNPGDRVTVHDREPGTVKNVAANGDPYVILDQGSSAIFAAAFVAPLTP